MSDLPSDAKILSRALLNTWSELDAHVSLPSLLMRQIDDQRRDYSTTRPAREYFEAICYERLLLLGFSWDKTRRQSIASSDRSVYLDWLLMQRFNLEGMEDEPGPIADPAYWRWANLKYADAGSGDRSTWRSYLVDARNAAIADCAALQSEPEDSSLLRPFTPSKVKSVLVEAISGRGLQHKVLSIESAGFGARFPFALRDYYIDCRIRDVDVLSRRIVPFDFEIASDVPAQKLRLAGDWSIWPGAAEYRNVCTVAPTLAGVCAILALFVQTLVAEVARLQSE